MTVFRSYLIIGIPRDASGFMLLQEWPAFSCRKDAECWILSNQHKYPNYMFSIREH